MGNSSDVIICRSSVKSHFFNIFSNPKVQVKCRKILPKAEINIILAWRKENFEYVIVSNT